MAVFLPYLQELIKEFYSVCFQFPRIHQLLLVFPPVSHAALFWDELRWPTLIGLHEIHNLTPVGSPFLILGHTSEIIIIFWPAPGYKHIRAKIPQSFHQSYDLFALHTHFLSSKIPSTSCGTNGPSLHSNTTLPDSKLSSLCHTPLGISTPYSPSSWDSTTLSITEPSSL